RARGTYFGLHRGELIDYFPPLSRLEFRPLGSNLVLVGAAVFADDSVARAPALAAAPALARGGEPESVARVAPGTRIRALISVVRRGHLTGDDELVLSIEGAG